MNRYISAVKLVMKNHFSERCLRQFTKLQPQVWSRQQTLKDSRPLLGNLLRQRCLIVSGTSLRRFGPATIHAFQARSLHTRNTLTSQPSITNLDQLVNVNEMDWRAEDFENRIFEAICDKNETVSISRFKSLLNSIGLRNTDPRLRECMRNFQDVENSYNYDTFQDSLGSTFIDRNLFKECIQDNIILITKALKNSFIIPDFPSFRHNIDQIYWDLRANRTGQVATYIPQLARMNPEYWAVSICTVDGQRHSIGDVDVPFTLQSCSKPLTYALVQDEYNPEYVHKYIGREPSGRSFNEIKLDYQMKPHNPMINAGAILIASLVKPQMNSADRFDYVLKYLKRMAGGEYVSFSNPVFLSEKETADRNFALGYYMRENKCFPANVNLMDVMDFYFQLCSVEVTSDSTAVMAATLANGGYCPLTDEKVIDPASVRNTLSLMHSCGMYDWSGEFAFKVGLPAKSGVSGNIMIVVPNVMGICVYSPPLDSFGNSVRGIQFCQELVNRFNFHHYDNLVHTPKKVDPTQQKMANRALDAVSLLFGAYNGDVTAMRRYHLLGMDMNLSDYDGRTALHLASSEGHEKVVSFLIEKCKVDPFLKDRWNNLPYDDAKRYDHGPIKVMLHSYMMTVNREKTLELTAGGVSQNDEDIDSELERKD